MSRSDSNPSTRLGGEPWFPDLRGIVSDAVVALCELAEEVQAEHPDIADRIWEVTNEHLEVQVTKAVNSPT